MPTPLNKTWRRALIALYVVSSFLTAVALAKVVSRTVTAQSYTFEQVAAGLKHQDAATRLRAIQILTGADSTEAVVAIAATLEDPDDRVQLAAINAERSLFTPRPVSRRRKVGYVVEVRTIVGGDSAADGQLALKARAVPVQVLSGLAGAMRDNNPRVRAEAVNLASLLAPHACGFGSAGQTPEICTNVGNALIDNINSRDAALRRAAMQTLGQVRYPNSAQALSDQLSYYRNGPDAMAALEGLAGIGDPTSVSHFRELLPSPNADLRRLGVEGLARADERDALTNLQQIAQTERSSAVLLAVHYAHVRLGSVGSSLQQLVAALHIAAQRPLALKYLLDLAPSMAPALAPSLRDQNPEIRRLVADVIGFSRDASVIAALEAAVKDSDPDVVIAAQRAIDRIKLK